MTRASLIFALVVLMAQAAIQDFPVFSDVAAEAGLTLMNISGEGRYDYIIEANGNGAAFFDYDNDGDMDVLITNGSTLKRYAGGGDPVVAWPDIYVANDSVPNLLFRNKRDGTFEEIGLISGTALNLNGKAQAGMGVAVGDYDANGFLDIFVTNFAEDTNTLYKNLGGMIFSDVTIESGAARVSRPNLGWGTEFVDFDNDGWLDLFVANGHVYPEVDRLKEISRYLQPKELYRNLGNGTFAVASGGVDLAAPRPARGAAFGDYDNDGDVDVLTININSPPNLYRNEAGRRNSWIGFRLVGAVSNRDAIGARVEIAAAGRTQIAEVRSGGSYLSHNDMRVRFGLGSADSVEWVRIRWPNGKTETRTGIAARQYATLHERDAQ